MTDPSGKVYRVEEITEADYGCEECPPDGPHAMVRLLADDGEERRTEVSECFLKESRIDEGSLVCLDAEGNLSVK